VGTTTSQTDSPQRSERRSSCRYAIQTSLQYRLISRQRTVDRGSGELANISKGGLLFQCHQTIPPKARIELTVDWPAHGLKVALQVVGQTVRSQDAFTAVRILRSSFRVQEGAIDAKRNRNRS